MPIGGEAASDEGLMELYQEGDAAAFRTLFNRYEGLLYNFFLRRLGNPADAEDHYQKTFLRLHQARQDYDPSQPFRPWLFTIAYNLFRDELRRRGGFPEVAQAPGQGEAVSPEASPESKAAGRMTAERVREAVLRLPEMQRQVVLMSKFEGLSYGEVARITGQSENAVKQMAHRAFVNLKEALGRSQGGIPDDL